jgi:methionyl-tRNA synthetase
MAEPVYITTPIYYVNDQPHIGHAYTTILGDVLARYARLQGRQVFFLTGVDEHGQKVQEAAHKVQMQPQDYVEGMYTRFEAVWKELAISNDDFIRTTQERHVRIVTQVLQDLWQRGEIYRGDYEGWYCIPDERFWTEKDLMEGVCPDCGRPVERIIETNYFFRMSTYQPWLIDYIQSHDDFILPVTRRNEVLGFLNQPLGDLCISRPVNRLSWGIPLSFDPEYVTYVWFDALLNYITAPGYGVDIERFDIYWPQAMHLIGKDILTTHSVYWPTMLKAIGLPMPKTIFAHGWWVSGGAKMSKSLGNVVRPLDFVQIYGTDPFRYFLMRDMTLGQDADFEPERLASRYQVDLANNLGNLLHRVLHMIVRSFAGQIPAVGMEVIADSNLRVLFEALPGRIFKRVEHFAPHLALAEVMDALTAVNQYLEQGAPWKLSKAGDLERAGTQLYHAAEALRIASLMLFPVMPGRVPEIWQCLGWQPCDPLRDGLAWGGLSPGNRVTLGQPLFPRLDK